MTTKELKKMKRFKKVSINDALIKVFTELFLKYGLTFELISHSKGHVTFRFKEINSKIQFDYDGMYIDIVCFYKRKLFDFIPIIAVPFVSKGPKGYYGHWAGREEKRMGPYKTKEALLKKFLGRHVKRFSTKRATRTLRLNTHVSSPCGSGWSEFDDPRIVTEIAKKRRKENKKYLVQSIPFWKGKNFS